MPNTIAILQARMSSRRLPGKVLRPLLGKPMLARQIERLGRAESIDGLVVATSDDASDDPIAAFCKTAEVDCFRGSLNDVLDRYRQCAKKFGADQIIRLTGDCPLADPEVIDLVVGNHLMGENDYTSNTLDRSWPQGLDVEIASFKTLDRAWNDAHLPSEREHVMPYIWKRPKIFKLGNVRNSRDLSDLRWTVDEPVDFELIEKIYGTLYDNNPAFGTRDVLSLIERQPGLVKINAHVDRAAGLKKSLDEDEEYLSWTSGI